jgi:hypothetical protein
MADILSADQDELDSKASDNVAPGLKKKKGWGGSKGTKIGSGNLGGLVKVSKGIGTRKSTGAPKGFGRKGNTTKANALKNA